MESTVCNSKRTIFARFDAGEDLMGSLVECVRKNEIRSGIFSFIGGLKSASYGLYYKGERKEFKKDAAECFEILGGAGNITVKENETMIHAHITAADEETGAAFGGHLMEGSIVYPFVEVCIQEFDSIIERKFDSKIDHFSRVLRFAKRLPCDDLFGPKDVQSWRAHACHLEIVSPSPWQH